MSVFKSPLAHHYVDIIGEFSISLYLIAYYETEADSEYGAGPEATILPWKELCSLSLLNTRSSIDLQNHRRYGILIAFADVNDTQVTTRHAEIHCRPMLHNMTLAVSMKK